MMISLRWMNQTNYYLGEDADLDARYFGFDPTGMESALYPVQEEFLAGNMAGSYGLEQLVLL